jgi:hypothetical protein
MTTVFEAVNGADESRTFETKPARAVRTLSISFFVRLHLMMRRNGHAARR